MEERAVSGRGCGCVAALPLDDVGGERPGRADEAQDGGAWGKRGQGLSKAAARKERA